MARAVPLTCLVLVAALAGCHGRAGVPLQPTGAPPAPQLPVVERGHVEPDASAVPTTSAGPFRRPVDYRRLTAPECRKFAIANAPFATDLDRHEENDPPAHPKAHKKATEFAEG